MPGSEVLPDSPSGFDGPFHEPEYMSFLPPSDRTADRLPGGKVPTETATARLLPPRSIRLLSVPAVHIPGICATCGIWRTADTEEKQKSPVTISFLQRPDMPSGPGRPAVV